MRALIGIVLYGLGLTVNAQTPINKIIPVQAGQKVQLDFDYPELIKVTTWDRNEISIQGSVSINGGENDDAFQLSSVLSGSTWRIESEIQNDGYRSEARNRIKIDFDVIRARTD